MTTTGLANEGSQPVKSVAMSDAHTLTVSFADNRNIALLCGEHDKHLKIIEQNLGLTILPRGNHLAINGPKAARTRAAGILQSLYGQVERGLDISTGDVEGAIRMAPPDSLQDNDSTPVTQVRTRKKIVLPRSPNQKHYLDAIAANELVFGIGPAGTGKTYLAVACAAAALARGSVERIILSRPAIEAGENLGFLPGDMKEKVDPYLRPLYDALYDVLPAPMVTRAMDDGTIEIAPLAFMRGRTLKDAFVILDEAQNTTPLQMKMFLTRLGENSRMVITGDPTQIDLPEGTSSGLIEATGLLKGVKGIGLTTFVSSDIVRHPLVSRIVDAYEAAGTGAASGVRES